MTAKTEPPPLSIEEKELLQWALDHQGTINFSEFMQWKAERPHVRYVARRHQPTQN